MILRDVSLDAFRGFTIAAMILVNNPGDWAHVYDPLEHAPWHGWTFTDTIFPFFLFICGVSMALSIDRRAREGADRRKLVLDLVRRGAVVFAIGFALNLVPAYDFSTVRIPGVLQRIGLCIALAAPLVVHLRWRGIAAAIAALLAVYSVVMLGWGVLEPGRDAGAFVDRLLMDGHLWSQSRTWDPEGLVSTLPALASLLFGFLAGRWLLTSRPEREKDGWLLVAGALAIYAGWVLDATLMPINKSLWTVSYCVFMTGWALLALVLFRRIGIAGWSRPFVIYGMNALFIFALSSLVAKLLIAFNLKEPIHAAFASLPIAPVDASLLYAIAFDLLMFSIAWAMWRKRWFIKV